MPGLMTYRDDFSPTQPFKCAWIIGSLHVTIQNTVLIENYTHLGDEGEMLQEYRWSTERALDWGLGGGPHLIVDDSGNANLLIHEAVKAENKFSKASEFPNLESTMNIDFQMVLELITETIKMDPLRYHRMKEMLVGVFEETTTSVKRRY